MAEEPKDFVKNFYLCGAIAQGGQSSVTGTTKKTAKMKQTYSTAFLLMAILFVVCLITSNLFASKIICILGVNLPGAVIVFPLSYIIGDCLTEVWGFKKAQLVIWAAFAMNLLVILLGQLVIHLPAASFWEGGAHFDYMFNLAPRIAAASLLAFLVGTTINSLVMSRMKLLNQGRRFGLRAILSSIAGECTDSLIFMPIAFFGTPLKALLPMMLAQVSFKVAYEIIILPLTTLVVRRLKQFEQTDTFDNGISYNPFKLS